MSEVAAPLAYPPGGRPREKFLVPLRPPEPVPPLGVRLLPWHIAGQFDEKSATWLSLRNYATQVDRVDTAGWVQVLEQTDGTLEVRAGFHDQTHLRVSLDNEPQGNWTYQPQRYECRDGGLVVYGAFPPPPQENPTGQAGAVGAKCTFYRAIDGSLVMLEDAYTGVVQGTMQFQKWWRWRPAEPGTPVISP